MATYIKTGSSGNVVYEIEPGNTNEMLQNEKQGGGEPDGYSDVVQSISNSYSSEATYNTGDIVFYENKLYQATEDITTAETWTPEHWQQITLAGEITDLKDDVSEDVPMVYEVGPGKTYTSFIACLKALQGNSKNKKILVYEGTYDIFEELGGAEYASTIDVEGDWKEYNVFVPPNTIIRGVGDVIFEFLPDASEIGAAKDILSVINVEGNVEIENIRVYAKNCSSCIRDETSLLPEYNNAIHKYKNIEFIKTEGGGSSLYFCIFQQAVKIIFENCRFESSNISPFTMLNADTGYVTLYIDNSVFITGASIPVISLMNRSANAQRNAVNICGCYFQGKYSPRLLTVRSASYTAVNTFDVTLIGCTDIGDTTISIENNQYPIKQYNAMKQANSDI